MAVNLPLGIEGEIRMQGKGGYNEQQRVMKAREKAGERGERIAKKV